jgi:hypothetical protein
MNTTSSANGSASNARTSHFASVTVISALPGWRYRPDRLQFPGAAQQCAGRLWNGSADGLHRSNENIRPIVRPV